MSWKFGILLAVLVFIGYAQKRGWIDLLSNKKPSGNQVLGVFDEVFAPARHEAQLIQQERKEAPMRFNDSDEPFKAEIELEVKRRESL